MRIGYLECFAGISGDMLLAALIDAGVSSDLLQQTAKALNIGAGLRIHHVDRSGIRATKVDVLEMGKLAEATDHGHEHNHENAHTHEHTHTHTDEHGHTHTHTHTHATTSHTHSHASELERHPDPEHAEGEGSQRTHSHAEAHTHSHTHGRSWKQIRELIQQTALPEAAKSLALKTFELLAQAEAKIHGMPVADVHFHEVGSVDTITDIVCSAVGLTSLGIDQWHASPVNVGSGFVECAHGTFPVPAPATAELLKGIPTYSAGPKKELVTPTGAALLRALECTFGDAPNFAAESIGYGAGTRNPDRFPNVLRLSIGESNPVPTNPTSGVILSEAKDLRLAESANDIQPTSKRATASAPAPAAGSANISAPSSANTPASSSANTPAAGSANTSASSSVSGHDFSRAEAVAKEKGASAPEGDTVTVLECAIDDASPQILAHTLELAIENGALDAMAAPVTMKKGRLGTLLTILARPQDAAALEELLFRETTTLGIRHRNEQRSILTRSFVTVETAYGRIRVKVGSIEGQPRNAMPEYEDCRRAAREHAAPLKSVIEAALLAFHAGRSQENQEKTTA